MTARDWGQGNLGEEIQECSRGGQQKVLVRDSESWVIQRAGGRER